MVGDPSEDVAQISLGVEPVEDCGLDQSVEDRGPLATAVGAGE
jgi:hypothetical protein